MPDLKPMHNHWRRKCAFCGTTMSWCKCEGTSADNGSMKTLHGICDKCSAVLPKENKGIDPTAPLKTKEYLTIIGDMFFYLVDQDEVQLKWTGEFVMAGSWKRFSFIPKFEGWIDIALDEFEIKDCLMHEYIESHTWDYYGGDYNKAHYATLKLQDWYYGNLGGKDGEIDKMLQGDVKKMLQEYNYNKIKLQKISSEINKLNQIEPLY